MNDEHKKEIDSHSGVETTGHEWDGLKELNNPAPRWWLIVFIITVIWAVGYWIIFPAWPTLSGNTKGTAGWTSHKKLAEEQAEITARRGVYAEQVAQKSLQEIQNDPKLYEFAVAGGKAAFRENCAACHGTGAQGGHGYPNLNDDDWLHGGKLDDIYTTIKYGVRAAHEKTKGIPMPAFAQMLKPEQIGKVADHVLSLSGKGEDNAEGAELFAQNCSSCHGNQGEGNRSMGAPKLNDQIWLYGGERGDLIKQISNPRLGVMPTWEARLPDETIKELTVYVHSLGGGEANAAPAKKE